MERRIGERRGVPASEGRVRTVFVFLDLPRHIEYRAGDLPLVPEGTVIEFDTVLKNPRDLSKARKVCGPYSVSKRILKYATGGAGPSGLTQYLEFSPDPR